MIEYYSSILKNRDTSYKIFLLKYLFTSVTVDIYKFTFKELACGIVSCAWDSINDKGKAFSYHDKLYELFMYIIENYGIIDNYSSCNEVFNFLFSCTDKVILKYLNNLVVYVPYRLLVDENLANILKGEVDRKKNDIIIEYSQRCLDTIYYFEDQKIILRNEYIENITKRRSYLLNWINEIIKKELS